MTEKLIGKANRESDPKYMRFLHEWAESRHSRSYPKRQAEPAKEPDAMAHCADSPTPEPVSIRERDQGDALKAPLKV
jgi:hypothetical protein